MYDLNIHDYAASTLNVRPADTSPDGRGEYMLILGNDVRFADGRMGGTPTNAEVRFWVFDQSATPRVPGRSPWAWYLAIRGGADYARQMMNLPAGAGGPGPQTGADVLIAVGLARAPS